MGNGPRRCSVVRQRFEKGSFVSCRHGVEWIGGLSLIPGSKSRFCLVRIQTHREASCIVARRRGTSTSTVTQSRIVYPTRRRSPGDIVLLEHRAPSTEHHTTEHQSLNTAPTQPNGPNGQPSEWTASLSTLKPAQSTHPGPSGQRCTCTSSSTPVGRRKP